MNRPSFFIVGHSKCGTTALAQFLGQHPELFVCDPCEPNFFCPSFCRAPGPPSCFFSRTEAEYLSLFHEARPNQACGEASAAYLYSGEAAERIHDFDSVSRIIMIFREPADFLRSYHLQLLKNTPAEGETIRDLGEAIRLEPARRAGKRIPAGCLVPELLYYTTDRLRYDEHYDRYARVFPSNQILPLVYDDFRVDNRATVRRVFEFLGVDPAFEPMLADHNTGGAALRSRRLQGLLHRATHAGGLAATSRSLLPKSLRRRAVDAAYRKLVFEEAPPIDAALVAEIREKARPHVAELGLRLNRDLIDEWDYSRPPAEPSPV